jgi:hypothetical protein
MIVCVGGVQACSLLASNSADRGNICGGQGQEATAVGAVVVCMRVCMPISRGSACGVALEQPYQVAGVCAWGLGGGGRDRAVCSLLALSSTVKREVCSFKDKAVHGK